MENTDSNVPQMIPESKEAKLNVNKIDWLKVSIAAVVIIAIIIAGYMIFAKSASASVLKSGDSANMEFTFIVDGKTVVSNESTFKVGSMGSQFGMDSKKIDDAVTGLKNGESVTVKFNSSEAYGAYDPSLIQILNRTEVMPKFEEINRTIEITSSVFSQAFNEAPVLNKIYSPTGAPWDYKVVSFTNSSVVMSQEPTVGKVIPLNDFMYVKVVSITSDMIKTERVLNEESKVVESPTGNVTIYSDAENIYFKLTPIINETITLGTSIGTVLSFTETSMVFDTNNPYAGKTVELVLKVLDIKSSKTVTLGSDANAIKGAPTLEVFVMSYCPYGLQMEKGVIPAYELLKGKANFKIRFVSYVLHGQKETDENNRQICIREETKQFWPYLQCFVDKGQGSESQCMKDSGIDEAKITDCMTNRAEGYMAVDKELNTQYGVQGSPTNVLDGKEVQIYPRSPQDVLNAVCNAFTTKPTECSTKLDTANPSAGFGFGTSTATSAASCG